MEGKQIFTAIPDAVKLIEAVGKDHKNEKQGWKFRSIDDVYNAANKAIAEVGITICPKYDIITDKTEEVTNSYGKKAMQNEIVLKANYRIYAKDGSYIEVVTFGKKLDYGDKGYNAAMSTAYKYMMFQVFCIPTEEEAKIDPDNQAPTIDNPIETKTKPKKETKSEPALEEKHKTQIQYIYKVAKVKNVDVSEINKKVFEVSNQNDINKLTEEQLKKIYAMISEL